MLLTLLQALIPAFIGIPIGILLGHLTIKWTENF